MHTQILENHWQCEWTKIRRSRNKSQDTFSVYFPEWLCERGLWLLSVLSLGILGPLHWFFYGATQNHIQWGWSGPTENIVQHRGTPRSLLHSSLYVFRCEHRSAFKTPGKRVAWLMRVISLYGIGSGFCSHRARSGTEPGNVTRSSTWN